MSFSPPFPPNLLPDEGSPEWMNKADNAWQLVAATLVGLQSVPGLMILYGGAVKKKWAVNSAFMVLYAFAMVLVCWVCWGYRMSFGDELVPVWGKGNIALTHKYLFEQAFLGMFPNATIVFFQFVFAAITLILIAASCFGSDDAFTIWSTKGWLSKMGIIDFAGGYVIHLSSGVAGYTTAYWVGPRLTKDRENFPPNNIIMMLAGAGLLWMGWTGFNGGSPYVASVDASLAVLNTHVCAATSLLIWLILDIIFFKKPSAVGAVQGMITGLVCITPGAGVVQGYSAIIMGVCAGSIPWFTMMVVHKRVKLLQKVDDTMAMLHTHAVAGILGGILTGLFAEPHLCKLFYGSLNKYMGLFHGLRVGTSESIRWGVRQMGIQAIGILFVLVVNVVMTSLVCLFVRLLVPLRMTDDELEVGDEAVHGEVAYAISGQGEKVEIPMYSSYYNDIETPSKYGVNSVE
ncbi:putative ammonium transporter AmtB-like domain, ammonium/urea transporter [Helianthus annuus]|nr:putative ammonium transporter AmtB-like domain, ammonium/urea transporter [Helianthus annuus]KAJ0940770.1 putative ammonium transporter AmtB-like domain, ammonium/urea transporter [Helianthus annuus]